MGHRSEVIAEWIDLDVRFSWRWSHKKDSSNDDDNHHDRQNSIQNLSARWRLLPCLLAPPLRTRLRVWMDFLDVSRQVLRLDLHAAYRTSFRGHFTTHDFLPKGRRLGQLTFAPYTGISNQYHTTTAIASPPTIVCTVPVYGSSDQKQEEGHTQQNHDDSREKDDQPAVRPLPTCEFSGHEPV